MASESSPNSSQFETTMLSWGRVSTLGEMNDEYKRAFELAEAAREMIGSIFADDAQGYLPKPFCEMYRDADQFLYLSGNLFFVIDRDSQNPIAVMRGSHEFRSYNPERMRFEGEGDRFYINELFIDRNYRGYTQSKKIIKRLLILFQQWARLPLAGTDNPQANIITALHKDNHLEALKRFYKGFGLEAVGDVGDGAGIMTDFYKPEDLLFMRRPLFLDTDEH